MYVFTFSKTRGSSLVFRVNSGKVEQLHRTKPGLAEGVKPDSRPNFAQSLAIRARVNSPKGGSLRRSTRRTEGVESIQSPRIDHANSGCQPSSAPHLERADSIQAIGPWPLPT